MFVSVVSTDNLLTVTNVWDRIVNILLNLGAIIVILVVGWLIAGILGSFVKRILKIINVDSILMNLSMKERIEKSGMKISLAEIGGEFVKWVIILLALIAATESVGLTQVAQSLNQILSYVPNIIVAVIILVIGMLIADFAYRISKSSLHIAGLASPELIGSAVRWVVIIFAILMALDQLGLRLEFIKIFLIGVVAMFALAGGIAFGLGGKDLAKEMLEKMRAGK
jgi:hypothetical protein